MLLEAVEKAVEALGLREGRLLVAVSGGIDSTVLLHALRACRGPDPLDLVAAHIDHGLRGDESVADEAAVRCFAEKLGIDYRMERIDPQAGRLGHTSRTRPTLQEAARSQRYEALGRIARELGARHIATAHNLDDQAETLLLHLLRGCGPDALGGMAEIQPDGLVVRPLLSVSRVRIVDYAREHGIEWREDSSNTNPKYTRNRLRGEWMPGLAAAFNPRLIESLGRLAESQRRDREWIQSLVDEAAPDWIERIDPNSLALTRRGWEALPESLARRLVQRAFREMVAARDFSSTHLERVLDFLRADARARGGAFIELPGGLRLVRKRECYLLRRNGEIPAPPC